MNEEERRRRRDSARHRARLRQRRERLLAVALGLAATAGAVTLTTGGDGDRRPATSGADQAASAPAQPAADRARRRPRPLTPLQLAVRWAKQHKGMHEVGTTNCSPAIARWERAMGVHVPDSPPCQAWCGAFLHEAFRQGGIDLSWRLIDPNASYSDAIAGRHGLERIPKESLGPGDIVFFDLDRSAPPEVQATHEALVIDRPRQGKVRTAEGNVGHHVVTTRRGLRYVVLAARVTRQAKRARARRPGSPAPRRRRPADPVPRGR